MTSYPYILRTDVTLSSTDVIYGTNYDSATMGYTTSHYPAYTFKDNVSVKFTNNIPLTTSPFPIRNNQMIIKKIKCVTRIITQFTERCNTFYHFC